MAPRSQGLKIPSLVAPLAGGAPRWQAQPLLKELLSQEVQLVQMGLVQSVHGEVVPEGGQGVPCVDRYLVLRPHLGVVDVLQLGAQFVPQELEMILW